VFLCVEMTSELLVVGVPVARYSRDCSSDRPLKFACGQTTTFVQFGVTFLFLLQGRCYISKKRYR